MKVKYTSNNSGGSWWLSDEDWIKLEKNGWLVEWGGSYFCSATIPSWQAPDGRPEPCKNNNECPGHRKYDNYEQADKDRYLGALAKSAWKEFDSEDDAIEEFEKITEQNVSDDGCNCCGQPHSFDSEYNYMTHKTNLPEAFIFDIDGTLAKMNGRSPYDYSQVKTDVLNMPIFKIYRAIKAASYKILVFSGRDGGCRPDTEEWLKENGIEYDELRMREAGNRENDSIIKKRMYDEISKNYDVVAVFDDRDRVVHMWREIGLTCLQVDYGNF